MVILLEGILLTVLLKIYLTTQDQTFYHLIHLQENAQTAMHILREEIHDAGYMGCQRLTKVYSPAAYPPYFLLKENRLTGTDNEIIIRKMTKAHTDLRKSMANKNSLTVGRDIKIYANDLLMIADCQHAEIFRVKKVNEHKLSQYIVSTQPLHYQFAKNAEVGKLAINRFYITKTKRKNNQFIYSLYIENIKHERNEIIEGVEQLQIKYLLKQNGSLAALTYQQVQDWSDIRGVFITLKLTQDKIHKTWYSYIALEDE
jgi:hypothetical protein